MSKDKDTLIPELRFPEFEGDEEWEYLNGNKLFGPISNKNHNSDLPILAITQELGAIPREMINYHVSVSEKSVKSYKVVEVGDFIISLRSFQGGIEYSNYLGLCSPAYIILRKKLDIISDFYRHYFKSFLFIQDLNKNLEGIRDGKMISYKQFSDILIPKPNNQEQQKIATTLTTLDHLITAQKEKLESLKSHKQGLLQQLFPAKGSTVPELRFGEFVGEWDTLQLQEVLDDYKLGGNYKNGSNEEGLPLIKMGNIGRGSINLNNLQFISKGAKYDNDDILHHGDLLFNTRNTLDLVGKVAIWRDELNLALFNSNLLRLNFSKEYIGSHFFMNYLFNTEIGTKKLRSIATGTTSVAAIYTKDLLKVELSIPDPKEQQKIANCLSSLDELITAQSEKIEALKDHKKGLMQQLFPNLDKRRL